MQTPLQNEILNTMLADSTKSFNSITNLFRSQMLSAFNIKTTTENKIAQSKQSLEFSIQEIKEIMQEGSNQ